MPPPSWTRESPDGPPRVLVNGISRSQLFPRQFEEAAAEEIGMSLESHLVELVAIRGAAREAEQRGPAVRAEELRG